MKFSPIKRSNVGVQVEQFLRHKAKLWAVFRGSWRWDESHFDDDLTIAVLLTNEHIEHFNLTVEDEIFYDKWIARRRDLAMERERRRKAQVVRSKVKTKSLIDEAFPSRPPHVPPGDHE